MGATGVIAAEFRSKLGELAARLGLSVESAKLMFQAAIRQRMGPMMQQVCLARSVGDDIRVGYDGMG